ARARGLGRSDASLPNQDSNPVRRFHERQFDVGSFRKGWVRRQAAADALEPLRRQRAKHDALRIADTQRHGGDRAPADLEIPFLKALWGPHLSPEPMPDLRAF